MTYGRKTGGRIKGSRNKPKAFVIDPTAENLELLAAIAADRLAADKPETSTPKAVMLGAMHHFEDLATALMLQAKERVLTDPQLATDLGIQAQKFLLAAVQCAEKVAPYMHAKLLSIESRGDNAQDDLPFVVRAPAVVLESSEWERLAIGVLPPEPSVRPAVVVPGALQEEGRNQVGQMTQVVHDAPPARPSTQMPPGPRVISPASTEEWLAQVASDRKIA